MNWRRALGLIVAIVIGIFLYCEYFIYFIVLSKCDWPNLPNGNYDESPIKAMILADTHLLGPHRGHWFDKLKREWQMHRAFQTSMTLFSPEIVFILGDLFDEGDYVNHDDFAKYVLRFHQLFHTPSGTRVVSLVGNHDVGFHYRMHPYFTDRFQEIFNNTGVNLVSVRDVHFVTINSMAMENDGCYFCEAAKEELDQVAKTLNCLKDPSTCERKRKHYTHTYSRPILMQHFPTYRPSDEICIEHDSLEIEKYRENWEVLSIDATDLLGEILNPRLAFSGHSHHYCHVQNRLNIDEYTVASFSWRNKNNPSFVLAQFAPDSHAISVCYMPEEQIVTAIYIVGVSLSAVLAVTNFFSRKFGFFAFCLFLTCTSIYLYSLVL